MRFVIFLFCVLIPLGAYAAKPLAQPEDIQSITVLAPGSLAAPITELCKIYSLKTAKDVNAVFNSTSENIKNIEVGDPADIVIIPSRKWYAELGRQGVVDSKTTSVIAKNSLVVAASKQFAYTPGGDIKIILENIYNKSLLVVADAETDALGEYSQQALLKLGLWDKFKPRIVPAPDSSAAANLIIKGQSAGIIYNTDAKLFRKDLNIVAIIPQVMHKPIEYLASVVVGNDMEESRKFLAFLGSKEAKQIFIKYGFVVQ